MVDHPASWARLGSPDKLVAGNEQQTVIVQRRCLRALARSVQAKRSPAR